MLIEDLKLLQQEIAKAKQLLTQNHLSSNDRSFLIQYIIEKTLVILVETEGEIRRAWLKQELQKRLN